MKRLLTLVAAGAIALAAAISPATARSLEEIIASGTIRIGINPNSPPMSAIGKDNQFEGFDIDVGNAIAKAMNIKVEFVPTEVAQRIPFLTSGQADIMLGALTRNPPRALLVDFTVPLHTESMSMLSTDKLAISSWKELNDEKYTYVTVRSTWTVDFLKEQLPKAKVLLVDANADAVRAVAQGRADAMVDLLDFYMAFTQNYPDVKWKKSNDTVYTAFCAIGVPKGNPGLVQFLNTQLFAMHSSGEINQLWEKWFKAPMQVPVPVQPFF
ncbi:MAG: transporter substrate-binding domain-containing protein [Labrys sp. (in: a-proteobacteria)]